MGKGDGWNGWIWIFIREGWLCVNINLMVGARGLSVLYLGVVGMGDQGEGEIISEAFRHPHAMKYT
jgi:hypothetical protein